MVLVLVVAIVIALAAAAALFGQIVVPQPLKTQPLKNKFPSGQDLGSGWNQTYTMGLECDGTEQTATANVPLFINATATACEDYQKVVKADAYGSPLVSRSFHFSYIVFESPQYAHNLYESYYQNDLGIFTIENYTAGSYVCPSLVTCLVNLTVTNESFGTVSFRQDPPGNDSYVSVFGRLNNVYFQVAFEGQRMSIDPDPVRILTLFESDYMAATK